jgi:hypothetical protein
MLVDVPSRASTIVTTVPVVAISKYVPETPADDPVIPGPIVRHCPVVPDSSLRRGRRVDRYDLSMPRRLRDHRR